MFEVVYTNWQDPAIIWHKFYRYIVYAYKFHRNKFRLYRKRCIKKNGCRNQRIAKNCWEIYNLINLLLIMYCLKYLYIYLYLFDFSFNLRFRGFISPVWNFNADRQTLPRIEWKLPNEIIAWNNLRFYRKTMLHNQLYCIYILE